MRKLGRNAISIGNSSSVEPGFAMTHVPCPRCQKHVGRNLGMLVRLVEPLSSRIAEMRWPEPALEDEIRAAHPSKQPALENHLISLLYLTRGSLKMPKPAQRK